jgi:hypothetical protein
MKKFIVLSLASFAVFLISGCSNSTTTTPPTPTTQTNVTPKAGSTYTYAKHEKDSASGKSSVTTDSIIVATVVSSGQKYQGKDSVVTVYDDYDTLRYHIESNNDVSVYRANFASNGYVFTNPSPWMTLPFGSKKTGVVLFPAHDTVISANGISETLTISGTVDYVGTDEIDTGTAHKKFVSGPQAKLTITISGSSPVVINITATQTYSFDYYTAGSYFHSIATTTFPDVKFATTTLLAGSTSFSEKILTSMSLK